MSTQILDLSVLPHVQSEARGILNGVIGFEDSHFSAEGAVILAKCFDLASNEVHDWAFHEVSLGEEQADLSDQVDWGWDSDFLLVNIAWTTLEPVEGYAEVGEDGGDWEEWECGSVGDPETNEAKSLQDSELEKEASQEGKGLEAVGDNASSLHCFPCIGVPWVHHGHIVVILSPELSEEERSDCLGDGDETCSEVSS